eukprot:scaffold77211_cov23-Tisochrysis_lutea.AAC.1
MPQTNTPACCWIHPSLNSCLCVHDTGGPHVGLTGTIRHKPSSSISHLQHEQHQQQPGLRRLATSGDSSSSRGGMPSAWGDTVGSHTSAASALRPYDSLRAHATLRMDAHQSLLGPWQGQLFVSLVGVLQVMASLQRWVLGNKH